MNPLDEIRKKFGEIKTEQKRVQSNRIVSYSRVSDFRQSEDGDSIDTQLMTMKKYAKDNGYRIVKSFDILGESARKGQTRPSIDVLMDYVRDPKNDISNIIVFHSSRLSRDGVFGSQLIDELIELGVGIIDCDEPIDIFNFNGRLRQIMKFYESEKENNTRKVFFETNILKKLRTGQTMGVPPIGYSRKWIGVGKNRVQEITITDEGEMIKQIFDMKLNDYLTNVEISERITALGLKLSPSKVGKILSSVYYCGLIKDVRLIDENGIIEGKHPAIVSMEDFLAINSNRNMNLCNKKSTDREELPLRRHLVCPSCNNKMTGEFKESKNQAYYRCTSKGCKSNTNVNIIHPLYIDLLRNYTLNGRYFGVYESNLETAFKELNERNKLARKIIKTKMNELDDLKIKTVQRMVIDDLDDRHSYKSLISQIEMELAGLSDQLSHIRNDFKGIKTSIKNAIEITKDISGIWDNGCLETRLLLQKTIFPKGVFYDKKSNSLKPVEINKIIEFVPLINDSIDNGNDPNNPKIPLLDSSEKNGNRTNQNNNGDHSNPMNSGGEVKNDSDKINGNDEVDSVVVHSTYTSNIYNDNYTKIMEGVNSIDLFMRWCRSNKIKRG